MKQDECKGKPEHQSYIGGNDCYYKTDVSHLSWAYKRGYDDFGMYIFRVDQYGHPRNQDAYLMGWLDAKGDKMLQGMY